MGRLVDMEKGTLSLNSWLGQGSTFTINLVDLVFSSNVQLRALSQVYAAADGEARFVSDFVAAWDKAMSLDRFVLRYCNGDTALSGR